jgi:hypothetical protein
VRPPGSWTWASFARAHNASSARALTLPGKAAALYDGKKTKTYSDQANFVPFIVETGGRINAAGLHSSPGSCRRARLDLRGRHGRAALRGISRALALQQGYMLAQTGPAVSAAVALPVRERRDARHPEAQAQDVAEPFVLYVGVRHGHGLDDHSRVRARGREDVGSEEFVVLIFAAPAVRECRMRSAVRALSIARVLLRCG